MGQLHNLFSTLPKVNSKFVALYADGSGGDVFMRDKTGDFINHDGEILSHTWLEDSGYLGYMYLPKHFKLWFEHKDEKR